MECGIMTTSFTVAGNRRIPSTTIGPDTRSENERRAGAAIGGFSAYFDFIKHALLIGVAGIAAIITAIGVPLGTFIWGRVRPQPPG
jgi:hypothetical protein